MILIVTLLRSLGRYEGARVLKTAFDFTHFLASRLQPYSVLELTIECAEKVIET